MLFHFNSEPPKIQDKSSKDFISNSVYSDDEDGAAEEETKQGQALQGESIEQLYGQISMFDQITEENDYGRGEGDSDSANDGEDATTHIRKFRQQIEHLNSDLHDLIYEGEDGDSAEEDDMDSFALPHT